MLTANEVRQQFIDFFVKKHGHTFVPSSSVVPHDDPTLLFSNAGMNQFKDVFLGTGTRPYKRAVNTQKCIRAGGKHNDLEDVGKDTYHHTFFEMLGNWSFGDYFKKEAIRWAWELLTKEWKLDKGRLHATVFEGDAELGLAPDDEAAALWRSETDIDPTHIHKGNKKDNFWEMGDTGPCGPCSEIHIDRTPDKSGGKLVNEGTADVIEIWNLVFIQFNRGADRKLTPLPAKHVDTGMGFERVCAVLQGKTSNYDTDVFTPIMDAIGRLTGKKYGGRLDDVHDIGFRVIADHLRMATFAITDGARPGNKKRDAVVRSVIRRAVRFGYQYFDLREPFVFKLVPALVEHMGGAYPELRTNPSRVQDIIKGEEADFLRTLERGLGLFEKAVQDAIRMYEVASFRPYPAGPAIVEPLTPDQIEYADKYPISEYPCPMISDTVAFDLYTTYGFPIDLIRQMAQERRYELDEAGLKRLMEVRPVNEADTKEKPIRVDEEGFLHLMKGHEEKSRGKKSESQIALNISGGLPTTDDQPKCVNFSCDGTVLGWLAENQFHTIGQLRENKVGLILDKTCFYAEQGGQVGDKGSITTPTGRFEVEDTKKLGETILHVGKVTTGHIESGQCASLEVSGERADTMRNHTATHLLNWALRRVLGEHVEQRGSLVDPDKTRFDFTHDKPLSLEEMDEIERLVNEKIYADLQVTPVVMPLAEAKKIPGVRAVFGEKYPDPVRVMLIGAKIPEEATLEASVEFCGGTHLDRTGQAGFFLIAKEEGVAKGVRRLTCKTAREAIRDVQKQLRLLMKVADQFHCKWEDLPARVESMLEENKKLKKGKGPAGNLAEEADKLLAQAIEANGSKIIVGEMPAAPVEQMRQQLDRLREKARSAVVVIGWADEGKVGLLSLVTDDLKEKGLHAGKLIGEVAKVVGGKGGGPPTGIAQAGGKDASKLTEALLLAKKLAIEKLSG